MAPEAAASSHSSSGVADIVSSTLLVAGSSGAVFLPV